jgi:hypothetical protein
MRYLIIALVCVIVVAIIYFVFVYFPKEDIQTIYRRLLINNNDRAIIAFTHERLSTGEYKNYYLNFETFSLDERIESYPVSHDGLPANIPEYHGRKYDVNGGFAISGIDFPFRCPLPFEYDGAGKCILKPVCGENEANLFRGINYYQFTEKILRDFRVHERLYYDCAEPGELKNCSVNELFVGGELLEKPAEPCEPYDICSDRMSRTVHRYPITRDDVLGDDEFYVCVNGVSERRRCSDNQQFSSVVMNCVDRNRCANEPNGRTFGLDAERFFVCRGGQEVMVNCGGPVIRSDTTNEYECRNPRCDNQFPITLTLNQYFRIPVAQYYCTPNNNTLLRFECDPSPITKVDNPLALQNTNYILPTLTPRFDEFEIPTKILENLTCVEFNFTEHARYITTSVNYGAHNASLPLLPYNVFTGSLLYGPNVYYRDRLSIIDPNGNRYADSSYYANFDETVNPSALLLNGNDVLQGDVDGVLYAVMIRYQTLNDRSSVSLRSGYSFGVEITDPSLYFNAYTGTFTAFEDAHALTTLDVYGGSLDDSVYATTSLFSFIVHETRLDGTIDVIIWSRYGAVLVHAELQEYVINTNNVLSHINLPNNLLPTLYSPFVGLMHNISPEDREYVYHHTPLFTRYFKILEILEPSAATSGDFELFDVDDVLIYNTPAALK